MLLRINTYANNITIVNKCSFETTFFETTLKGIHYTGGWVGEIFLCLISINSPTHFTRRGIMASLDLSAAFDLVNVELLVVRLRVIGLPSDLINLISTWLTDREF
jgi:hypothetical protein